MKPKITEFSNKIGANCSLTTHQPQCTAFAIENNTGFIIKIK